jgi:nucleoside-diphosphate-sugar epimerase
VSSQKVLVTGATGLLGSHLLFEQVQSGRPVRAMFRSEEGRQTVKRIFSYYTDDAENLTDRIEWIKADLLELDSLEKAVADVDEIYHCGAMVSFDPRAHARMLKVNIDGTANLVNLALRAGVGAFCHVSSIATLTRTDPNKPADEESYWVPSPRNSVYSVSKFGAEREVWRGMEEGLPAVIINPSVILGPGFWKGNSELFTLAAGGLKFYPKGVNGFVDVRDVVQAMLGLTRARQLGLRFVCSAENLPYRTLFTMMAEALDSKSPRFPVGRLAGGLAWRGAWVWSKLTGQSPLLTRETIASSSQEFAYSSARLLSKLDFSFRPMADTITTCCALLLDDMAAGKA